MATVKTAISLKKSLFKQLESLSFELKVPRSRLWGLALEEFLTRYRNRKLLEKINKAFAEPPDRSEVKLHHAMRHLHRKLLEDDGNKARRYFLD